MSELTPLPQLVAEIKENIFIVGNRLSQAKKIFDDNAQEEKAHRLDEFGDEITKTHGLLQKNIAELSEIICRERNGCASAEDVSFVASKLTGIEQDVFLSLFSQKSGVIVS